MENRGSGVFAGCLKTAAAAAEAEPRKGIRGQINGQERVLVGVGAEGWAAEAEPGGDICIQTPQGFGGVCVKFQ